MSSEPAAIWRRGWQGHPASRAAGEPVARLGAWSVWLLSDRMGVAQEVPRSGCVLGDGQGTKY